MVLQFTRIKESILSPGFIWIIIALLSIVSVLAVYSASGSITKYNGDNTVFFIVRHCSFLVAGFVLIWLFSKIDYTLFNRWAPVFLVLTILLLIYTIFFGVDKNDAKRWIQIPFVNLTFQVSDFAKLALIMYLARLISARQEVIKSFRAAFLPIMLPILIVCGLIAPNNLSTAGLLFIGCMAMMYVGRMELKYILALLGMGILLFFGLIFIENIFPDFTRADTWINRINAFLHGTGDKFQIEQAKMAIANGSWFGVLPGNSMLRNFIPYSYADFIYPVIVEEYGLILGGFGVIVIYLMLLVHCVGIVTNAPKAFGALLTIGIGINMVMQAYCNIAVSLELVPVTGLPLPFISMGGTALLSTSISFGMIISVSKKIMPVKLDSETDTTHEQVEVNY